MMVIYNGTKYYIGESYYGRAYSQEDGNTSVSSLYALISSNHAKCKNHSSPHIAHSNVGQVFRAS